MIFVWLLMAVWGAIFAALALPVGWWRHLRVAWRRARVRLLYLFVREPRR